MSDHEGAYWASLPGELRRDDALPANAKLLYCDISALTGERGYCYAGNEYLAGLYGWTERSVQRLIAALAERGYIRVERVPGKERRIYAGAFLGPPRSSGQVGGDKNVTPDKKVVGGATKLSPHNKVDIDNDNNTPHTPQGGKGRKKERKRQEPREAPDWKPDRFAGLWSYYPSKGRRNKQDAMRAWDDLQPDDALISTIARALKMLKATEEWQRNIGIPYVATFLRGRRWEDAEDLGELSAEPPSNYIEDRGLPVWGG